MESLADCVDVYAHIQAWALQPEVLEGAWPKSQKLQI